MNEGIKKFSTGCKQSSILDLILDVSKKLVEYDNSTLFVCQPHFTLKVAQECFSESSKTSTKAIDLFIDSIKHQEKCKQNSFKILLKNSRNTKKFVIEDANIILKLLLQDEYFYNNENTCTIANNFADIAEDWDETTKSLMCSLYKKNNCSVFKDLDFENVCSRAEEL